MLAVVSALASALSWGGADFVGGLASRRAGAYRVTVCGFALGLTLTIVAALLFAEPAPPWPALAWSAAAGTTDAVGILLLYTCLARGPFSIGAPVSALTGAAVPVVVGTLREGLPQPAVLAGLVLALVAVWLVSQSGDKPAGVRVRLADLRLPLLAGVFLGLFLVLMHEGSQRTVLWPLVAARAGGVVTLVAFAAIKGQLRRPEALPWRLVLLNAVLDVGGNALFILAGQAGRMDVAAVLSSLYPGASVLLAWGLLREKVSRPQFIGILAALGAIVLMTV
jgi:drug/metabolite transporter (DMT)-like permease